LARSRFCRPRTVSVSQLGGETLAELESNQDTAQPGVTAIADHVVERIVPSLCGYGTFVIARSLSVTVATSV